MDKNRYYGIDLLKLCSMYMVVILHILGRGGVLNASLPSTIQYWTAWFLEIACYCAVNGFALATGYLMVNSCVRYRKIISMWLIVYFYMVVLGILGRLFFGGGYEIKLGEVFLVAPITSGSYWYFTAYICLFFFIPVLNKAVESLSKKKCIQVLFVGFILFSVVNLVNIENNDCFHLNSGYSSWWLMYLYFLGASIRKYDLFNQISAPMAVVGYWGVIVFTWMTKLLHYGLADKKIFILSWLLKAYGSNRFISYTSPTIIAAAVFLMIFFEKISIPKSLFGLLERISPLVFQVYIIHCHPIIYVRIMENAFVMLANYNALALFFSVLGIGALIFICCILIDKVRYNLFKVLKVNEKIDQLITWIYNVCILRMH